MRQTASRKSGFTLVEMMIVVAIVALLAAIAVPNWVRARTTSQQNSCINNLRVIDGAKQQWALDAKASVVAVPALAAIQPYLGHGSNSPAPACPTDPSQQFSASYTMGSLAVPPACQISPAEHMLQ